MKILLLGGAGFIGSNLCNHLSLTHEIIVYDRPGAFFGNIEKSKSVHFFEGDFFNSSSLEFVFEKFKIEIVIHLISTTNPQECLSSIISDVDINLINTIKLIDIMINHNVNKIIYFSSGGTVYGNNGESINSESSLTYPINSYGWLKLTIENYIRMQSFQKNLNYLIVRPSNPYGPFQNIWGKQGLVGVMLGKLVTNMPIEIWGDGSIIRDYIYIDDLCKIVEEFINKNVWNDTFNIGSSKGLSINEIVELIKRISNSDLEVMYKKGRKTDFPVNILCMKKTLKVIGSFSITSAEEGILKTWVWVKNIIKQ